VYLQPSNDRVKLPVIVYIHGGKFHIGSGVSYVSGPTYLMDKDIVLVTINYRLGVLGKFCHVTVIKFTPPPFNHGF